MTYRRGGTTASCVALLCLVMAADLAAQQVSKLRAQSPPYYVGEPVVLEIVAKVDEAGAQPVCRALEVASEVSLSGPHVRQSSSTFMQTIGGRTTVRESINYVYSFVVEASAPGEYAIGPFEVEYKGKKQRVEGHTFRFQKLEDDPDMEIAIELPETPIYVGQRVPVTVRWAMSAEFHEIQYAFRKLEIRSPVFDQFELLESPPRTRTQLTIATASGDVALDAEQSTERRDGKEYVVLSAQATMIAQSVGTHSGLAITCRTERGFRWRQQGFFGGVQPTERRPALASGRVSDFSVKPLPLDGRPASFGGAVGRGYGIEVSANRTVVRVGDPISLTLTLTGEGLEKMGLPDLAADGGLSPEQFQLPSEPPAGNLDDRMKQFKLSVRVKDETVDQIPAIAYSWFDPGEERYVTVRSKPIALQVMPAQLLDANDVISARPEDEASPATDTVAAAKPIELARGANLAIERDLSQLVGGAHRALAWSVVNWGAYALGLGAVVVAVIARRRADIDPLVAEQRANMKTWRRQIQQAKTMQGKAAAQQIADGLRKFLTVAGDPQRGVLNGLIAQCEESIYAPDDQGQWDDVVRQALQVVDGIEA